MKHASMFFVKVAGKFVDSELQTIFEIVLKVLDSQPLATWLGVHLDLEDAELHRLQEKMRSLMEDENESEETP